MTKRAHKMGESSKSALQAELQGRSVRGVPPNQ